MIINWAEFRAASRAIDICIVGGGAAGLTLADALIGSGLSVLVLEAGGLRRTMAAQAPFRGEVADPAVHPGLEHFRVRAIGGASRAWGGRCLPFDPIDFEARDWVPGPGWPIDLQSLTDDYARAQDAAEAGPFDYDPRSALPGEPAEFAPGLDGAAIVTRLERFSRPTNFWNRFEGRLARDPCVHVLMEAPTLAIRLAADGRSVDHLDVRAPDGADVAVRARRYVLAAGGLETVRLMLASDDVTAGGVGGGSGKLGRFYMSHLAATAGRIRFNDPAHVAFDYAVDAAGVYVRRRMTLTAEAQRQARCLNIAFRTHLPDPADPAHGDAVLSAMYLNAALSLLYSLVQTLVFARALDHRAFALTILFQAIVIYLQPLSQCVARANFVMLREQAVLQGAARAPEAALGFHVNQALLLVVSVVAPLAAGVTAPRDYAAFACFMFFMTFSSLWFFEIQMAIMAVDRALEYERVSLLRRVINYLLLAMLFFTHDFLLCNIALALQTAAFHLYITGRVAGGTGLFAWPGLIGWARTRGYLARLWVSLQATGAEWLTLSAPYAIFFARFGVGPGLVTIDAMLKILRMVVSISRNLAEIALPRVSRAIVAGHTHLARLPAIVALGGGGLAALAIGVLVTFWQHFSFGLLLGPNNVAPPGAGAPTALALMAGVLVATGGHFIGHIGHRRAIPVLWLVALATVGAVTALILGARLDIVQALWTVAAGMTVIAIAATVLLVRILRA